VQSTMAPMNVRCSRSERGVKVPEAAASVLGAMVLAGVGEVGESVRVGRECGYGCVDVSVSVCEGISRYGG